LTKYGKLLQNEFIQVEKGFQNVWIKFNLDAYKHFNTDLQNSNNEDAFNHFITYGKSENRLFYNP
jgi:hypothetical protein